MVKGTVINDRILLNNQEFTITHDIIVKNDKRYEYGEIKLPRIHTPKEYIGRTIKIILKIDQIQSGVEQNGRTNKEGDRTKTSYAYETGKRNDTYSISTVHKKLST